MGINLLSRRKWLDHEEDLDRLRAHFLGMSYPAFIRRRIELGHQAEVLRNARKALFRWILPWAGFITLGPYRPWLSRILDRIVVAAEETDFDQTNS